MNEKFFIFTLKEDNAILNKLNRNNFNENNFTEIDQHVLLVNSVDLKATGKLRDELKIKAQSSRCYVSLHRSSQKTIKDSQMEIFDTNNTIFIEEHHNSGFIYEKLLEYIQTENKDEKNRIREEMKDYFETNKTLIENWQKLDEEVKNYINGKINQSNIIIITAELSSKLGNSNENTSPAEFYGIDLAYEKMINEKKHAIVLTTADEKKIKKFNKRASLGFLEVPTIHLIKITNKQDIESKINQLSNEIKTPPSKDLLNDIQKTFDLGRYSLDEILHPMYRPLSENEKDKIIEEILKCFGHRLEEKERSSVISFVQNGKRESLRELILNKIKPKEGETWRIPNEDEIKDIEIYIIEDEAEFSNKLKDELQNRGFKEENIQLISTEKKLEDLFNFNIKIQNAIFIIDVRLKDDNGKWWKNQGYDIIKSIKGDNQFFILSGKDKSYLLNLDSKLSVKVHTFSKDDLFLNKNEFDIFAKAIYDASIENSAIRKIAQKIAREEENVEEKVREIKESLKKVSENTIAETVFKELDCIINNNVESETSIYWGKEWSEGKIISRLLLMCYFDYLKTGNYSYSEKLERITKVFSIENKKMINNKLFLTRETFEDWKLMLPIETEIREIWNSYLSPSVWSARINNLETLMKYLNLNIPDQLKSKILESVPNDLLENHVEKNNFDPTLVKFFKKAREINQNKTKEFWHICLRDSVIKIIKENLREMNIEGICDYIVRKLLYFKGDLLKQFISDQQTQEEIEQAWGYIFSIENVVNLYKRFVKTMGKQFSLYYLILFSNILAGLKDNFKNIVEALNSVISNVTQKKPKEQELTQIKFKKQEFRENLPGELSTIIKNIVDTLPDEFYYYREFLNSREIPTDPTEIERIPESDQELYQDFNDY